MGKVKKNERVLVEGVLKNVGMDEGIFVDIFGFEGIGENGRVMKVEDEVVKLVKWWVIGKEGWVWKDWGGCEIEKGRKGGFMGWVGKYVMEVVVGKKRILGVVRGGERFLNRGKRG